jgi:glutamate synthase (NADPH/NADH) large chain
MTDAFFAGTPSRLGGIGIGRVARERGEAHAEAYGERGADSSLLPAGGFYKWRRDGESHAWNPETIPLLQAAVRSGSYEDFSRYSVLMDAPPSGPIVFRHLLKFKSGTPVPLDEVEGEEEIVKRFATGAMSYGSISGPAHQTIARAMNGLGGMSNTGEGGEDPARFRPLPDGGSLSSYTKQVASGRFGVTAYYLANARDIQIKIAQGAKPGEGGQLPGHKVSASIARTRYTTPGVTLISPPPHHDIYSIEDLAQLILDLKNVNPDARISVKLVSEAGVGTVAAGVAKGRAEMILISGGDGGTGASPLGSIKRAGLPWELGLAETHQTLLMNGLRSRVRLQCDGGIRTGRDAAIACMLGAEEFGFAASALISEGCLMLRHCHLNNCSVGVATQDERCAERFAGKPEYVRNLMLLIARHMREIMASLGFRKIDDMVGRSDMLEPDPGKTAGTDIDFSLVLGRHESKCLPRRDPAYVHPDMRQPLDLKLIELSKASIDSGERTRIALPIGNTDRSAGARLSGEIMKRRGEAGLEPGTIEATLTGVAGQSFGAWLCRGVTFRLSGMANDYVGKGLFGGVIAIAPGPGADFKPEDNVIIGNVALYGAISGELYVSGRAGERFCVRNSGATAVAEGTGDHGCEYMTGGTAVILGTTGRNFAAGMSGGIAYVWDPEGSFASRFSGEFADIEEPSAEDAASLKSIIERHGELTGSARAAGILGAWDENLPRFKKVIPRDYRAYLAAKGAA